MAKIEGTQSIPSVLLDLYRGTLTEKQPDGTSRKRYPYRVPNMQEGGSDVKAGQLAQRTRFKEAIRNFADVSPAERARWYAARPPWSSLLWYYNYFIMSDLSGNANVDQGGAGVIKSIQVVKEEVPTTGTKTFTISEVDPTKTVVMMFGNSFISDLIQRGTDTIIDGGTNNHVLSPEVDPAISEVKVIGSGGAMELSEGTGDGSWASPYAHALIAAQLTVKMVDTAFPVTTGYSWEVIEHKAQTIFPVLVSIAAEAVVIDWAKVPSVVADISILVIEYI